MQQSNDKMSSESPKASSKVPFSLKRLQKSQPQTERIFIGSEQETVTTSEEVKQYTLAHNIMKHVAVQAPLLHKSGHPGGPLSAFTFAYQLLHTRDPLLDAALRMSAGHLSLLAYTLEYLGGTAGDDERLQSPQAIIEHFRTPAGLPGHCEAGIGTIPFGFGPLGKGLSNALGYALGKKLQHAPGITDVLMGDGDCQEGQILEAARIASALRVDTLVAHIDFNDIQLSTTTTSVAAADLASIFHSCGWIVIEVENGNDLNQVKAAQDLSRQKCGHGSPVVIVYYTTMGNGIALMEQVANEGSAKFHGSPLSEEEAKAALKDLPSLEELVEQYEPFRQVLQDAYAMMPSLPEELPFTSATTDFGDDVSASRKDFGAKYIASLMELNEHIVVLHADLAGSGGFTSVAKQFPERVLNVGAAEANMYMMAAGLRQAGMLPLTYTFAAFGTNEARANARLIDINNGHTHCSVFHDCTHSGLSVGEDGETHQERHYLDMPFDNTQIWNTADTYQAKAMAKKGMEVIAEGKQSVFVFMPRSNVPPLSNPDGSAIYESDYEFTGKADVIRGTDSLEDQITIIATGATVQNAIAAADELASDPKNPVQARVLNVASLKPIDAGTIVKACLETQHVITVEDHSPESGLGRVVSDIIANFSIPCSLRKLGVSTYFPSGKADDLYFMAGIDTESIIDTCLDEVRSEVRGGSDALISCLYRLKQNTPYTVYEEQLGSFMLELLHGKLYLQELLEYWQKRAAEEADLPSTEEIQQMLQL